MTEQYSIAQYVDDLRRVTSDTADENEIFNQVGHLPNVCRLSLAGLKTDFMNPIQKQGSVHFSFMKKMITALRSWPYPGYLEWELDRTIMVPGQLLSGSKV